MDTIEIAVGTFVGFTASQFMLATFISYRERKARAAKLATLAALRAEQEARASVRLDGETQQINPV